MRSLFIVVFLLLTLIATPTTSYAGDGATILFRSGLKAYVGNGYKQILDAMDRLNSKSQDHSIVKFDIEGGTFVLNVAEVVIVCRDRCDSLVVEDLRDPKRGK